MPTLATTKPSRRWVTQPATVLLTLVAMEDDGVQYEFDPDAGQPLPGGGGPARVMGFDVGDRRIGVAVSDPLGYTAQPLLTIHRSRKKDDFKSIGRLLRRHGVEEAVVGNPLYMSGDVSPQALKAQAFAEELRVEFGVTVHLWDERLTTTQAHRHLDEAGGHGGRQERKGIIDQVAAVLILQSFLDARSQNAG